MKIAILDTFYEDFLASLPFDPNSTYDAELRKVLDCKFGTFDAYSTNLRKLGHECIDIVANHAELQSLWAKENGFRDGSIILSQIEAFGPDVIFFQDLGIFDPMILASLSKRFVLAGQLSCPWPGDEYVRQFACLFTSFPHFVPQFEALGVNATYLPLAFEPSVLEGPQPERDIDIGFVGGVGRDSHWRQGTDVLEAVAAAFPDRFQWWGYGVERLPQSSALGACYKGTAWGRDMYAIYRRSKIVINRHGEVAQGYQQNLRCFEATGCGALLLTEFARNFTTSCYDCGHVPGKEFFENSVSACAYGSDAVGSGSVENRAVDMIGLMLADCHGDTRSRIAAAGQKRTLENHTYAHRMKVVSEVLTEMLCPA